MREACYGGNRDLVLLMIEKGADIERCIMNLFEDDIMRLVKVGVKTFGTYKKMAKLCRAKIKETETVLNELFIFPEFSRLVGEY